jgi:hypothetical protein
MAPPVVKREPWATEGAAGTVDGASSAPAPFVAKTYEMVANPATEHLRGVGPAGARHDPAPALLQARQLRVLRQAAQHLRESQHNSPFTTHTSASSILRLPSSHLC